VDYPDAARELAILSRRAPGASQRLAAEVVAFVQRMRELDLFKAPGVAEAIDWTNALLALDAMALDPASIEATLGVLLKYQDDIARLSGGDIAQLLDALRARELPAA
jgi:MoxR-like ATPase